MANEFWCILRGVIVEGSEGELLEDCNITRIMIYNTKGCGSQNKWQSRNE